MTSSGKPKRRALVICDRFPPDHGVGGTRIAYFVRSLMEAGWACHVLTAFLPLEGPPMEIPGLSRDIPVERFRFDEAGRSSAVTLLALYRERWSRFRAPELGWWEAAIAPMRKRALELSRTGRFDVILSSTSTLYPVAIARDASRISGIPFVADFRDLLEQLPTENLGLRDRWFRRRLIRRRTCLLRDAAGVLAVTPQHAEFLGNVGPRHLVYNGFDRDLFRPSPKRRFQKFLITYAGRITDTGVRDPSTFFRGLETFLGSPSVDPEDVEVAFWGSEAPILRPFIEGLSHPECVSVHAPVPYTRVPELLAESAVLLLLTAHGRKGILPTKVFEYLAVGRPVLCTPDDGSSLRHFLAEVPGGIVLDTPEAVARQLTNWHDTWKRTGTVDSDADPEAMGRFSRQAQGDQLVRILEAIALEAKS